MLDQSLNVVSCPEILVKDRQTDRQTDYSNPPLRLRGQGLMNKHVHCSEVYDCNQIGLTVNMHYYMGLNITTNCSIIIVTVCNVNYKFKSNA